MNIFGCKSAVIQAGGKSARAQGGICGGDVCAPIYVGEDLISECFDPDPGWNGNQSVVAGEVVINHTGNGEDYWEGVPTPFSFDEAWCEAKVLIDSGAALDAGEWIEVFGFPAGTVSQCSIGLTNDGGTLKWIAIYRTDDDSSITSIIESPVFAVDTEYTLTCYFLKSSGPSANDGIIRLWVNTTMAFEITGIDNNAFPITRVGFGDGPTATGVTVTIRGDNCFAGTTGVSPSA